MHCALYSEVLWGETAEVQIITQVQEKQNLAVCVAIWGRHGGTEVTFTKVSVISRIYATVNVKPNS